MTHTTRTTRIHVLPEGAAIFDEGGFSVEIEDDAGGEFLIVQCLDSACEAGQIRLNPEEWPALRETIDRMAAECMEEEK